MPDRADAAKVARFIDSPHTASFVSCISFVAYSSDNLYDHIKEITMPTLTISSNRQSPPTARDAALARASGQRLSRYRGRAGSLSIRVADADQEQPLELPSAAVALLIDILEAMAAGRGVSIIPENAELTTVQAAAILNVSRPYLIKLLAEGAIPHRKVGKHRRILMEGVMTYKSRIDQEREDVLDRLAAEAQANDMGYAR
jgi:excisionase family DNA binding protein